MKDIEDFLRENKPQVKEDPTFILQAQRRMEQVEGIKAEVDRQSHRGRIALIVALVTGLVIGIAATAITFLYPVHPESVGNSLWQSARLFLQDYRQYLVYPVALFTISLILVLSRSKSYSSF